jgi:hypothetical protein
MEDLTNYYQKVTQVTQELKDALNNDDFILTNQLLPRRLVLLKDLDEKIKGINTSATQLIYYQNFLKDIQIDDQQQIDILLNEKSKLMQESAKKVKNKVAIGQYKNISQSK